MFLFWYFVLLILTSTTATSIIVLTRGIGNQDKTDKIIGIGLLLLSTVLWIVITFYYFNVEGQNPFEILIYK